LRDSGAAALWAPSAALLPGSAGGWKVDGGLQAAAERDGTVLAAFGSRPDFVGWMAAFAARPRSDLLARGRPLGQWLRVQHNIPGQRTASSPTHSNICRCPGCSTKSIVFKPNSLESAGMTR